MVEHKFTPDEVGTIFSKDEDNRQGLVKNLDGFIEILSDFWKSAYQPVSIHIEDNAELKAVYGGDLFPSYTHNIASTCGVYVDTIILPDPFLRSKPVFRFSDEERKSYYVMKRAMNILNYKSLALAEVKTPIVAVLPEQTALEEQLAPVLKHASEVDAAALVGRLFGIELGSFEECLKFVENMKQASEVSQAIVKPERLLFDSDWTGTPEAQIERFLAEFKGMTGDTHAGRAVVTQQFGRAAQTNELLLKSRMLGGNPLIDGPTSWKYFDWKMQIDAEAKDHIDPSQFHILRSLQLAADGEMAWLGNIPVEALIEMRREGALPEIREMITRGVLEILKAAPGDYQSVSDTIVENIRAAFEEHQKALSALSGKKWRFAGVDIGTCIVRGTIQIASACGVPLISLLGSVLDEVTEAPKLKDIPARYKALKRETSRLNKSAVGLLFKHRH